MVTALASALTEVTCASINYRKEGGINVWETRYFRLMLVLAMCYRNGFEGSQLEQS